MYTIGSAAVPVTVPAAVAVAVVRVELIALAVTAPLLRENDQRAAPLGAMLRLISPFFQVV
jgi:hypothetical protein